MTFILLFFAILVAARVLQQPYPSSPLQHDFQLLRGMKPATSHPSHVSRTVRKTNEMLLTDDVFGIIEFRSDVQYTVSLKVFLLDMAMLMDDESRRTFELTALKFIARGDFNVPLKSIGEIVVLDQRLTWSRLVDGKSSTGLEIYFQADATVTDEVSLEQTQQAIQWLFDSETDEFQRSFDLALEGEPMNESEPQPTTMFPLESARVTLGLASAIAGCVSFLFIVFCSACYIHKKEKEQLEEEKELSKTIDIPVSPVQQTRNVQQSSFPVQQISSKKASFIDSDEDLTYDDDFDENMNSKSLLVKENKDVTAFFESVDQSAIVADIELATDSDEGDEESDIYGYSPIQRVKGTLTMDDLNEFDNEVRRAEC